MGQRTTVKRESRLNPPKCFISYSWDNNEHRDWVRYLAENLWASGVETLLDQWDVTPGMDFVLYMNTSIRESDFVILVCTPEYAKKANTGSGGAGYENSIINSEMFHKIALPGKFVPILRRGRLIESLPSYLLSLVHIDFSEDENFEKALEELLRHIHKSPLYVRPVLGPKPLLPPLDYSPPEKLKKLVDKSVSHKRVKTYSSKKTLAKGSTKQNVAPAVGEDYSLNVFVNCPLTESYRPLFHAMVFAISDCGFRPRTPLEESDAGQARLERIFTIISECKFSIHDISRPQARAATLSPNFNVPLELGVFLGAMRFGAGSQRDKRLLLVSNDPSNYREYLSDIAGQDVLHHAWEQHAIIKIVRNWLSAQSARMTIPGSNSIWSRFKTFQESLPSLSKSLGTAADQLPFLDYVYLVYIWLRESESELKMIGGRRG